MIGEGSFLPPSFVSVYAPAFLLVAMRLMAALTASLAFGSTSVPIPVRVGLALLIAVALTPVVPVTQLPDAGVLYVVALIREAVIGLLAGFAMHLTFFAVQFAAGIIGVQMGLTLGGTYDPLSAEQDSVLQRLLMGVAMLVFFQIDGLHIFLIGLQGTFVALPIGDLGLPPHGVQGLSDLAAGALSAGLRFAMPVLGALLLADVGLALAAKTVPQLNLFAVGIPVKVALGLFGLSLALPPFTIQVADLMRALPADISRLAR